MNMIPISKPIISQDEIDKVVNVLKSGFLTCGETVKNFEKQFSKYCNSDYAIAISSGTAALHVSLLSLNIGKDDEVITSPFSFISSSNCILFLGAKPVFVDINPNTFNINPVLIEEKITKKTKAILPIHLYGQPSDMDPILEIAKNHDLFVIEDACQAHGAEYKGKKIGSISDITCFSFYATKNMTTGEGGMLTTNHDKIYSKSMKLRDHGQKGRYYHDELGFNFRMTNIQAAIGIGQLKKLDKRNEKRIQNAHFLTEKLESVDGLVTPFIDKNVKHVFHQYTIRVKKMKNIKLSEKLMKMGIQTKIYYPIPIHKQILYQKLGFKDNLPESEKAANEVLSLPVHPNLSQEDLDFIVKKVKECLKC